MNTPSERSESPSIEVVVSDFVLTPTSCAALVNEVIKNFMYQKSQIPYPYAWLKNVVTKRRSAREVSERSRANPTLTRHYQTVSAAYDAAERVMSNLGRMFAHYGSRLKEVVFVIGVTPVCPKEVLTIKLSSLADGHIERNHTVENNKRLSKVLRGIFLESDWMNLVENAVGCSNTYTFLKISERRIGANVISGDIFFPSKPLVFSAKIRQTVVNITYSETRPVSCCDDLEVFKDTCDDDNNISSNSDIRKAACSNVSHDSDNDTLVWLQSKVLIQGFKDCFINKVSACELW